VSDNWSQGRVVYRKSLESGKEFPEKLHKHILEHVRTDLKYMAQLALKKVGRQPEICKQCLKTKSRERNSISVMFLAKAVLCLGPCSSAVFVSMSPASWLRSFGPRSSSAAPK